jgi:hypothetical protein
MKMYSVYDSKVEAFMSPFAMRAKGEALRAFTTTVNDPQSNISQYPEDYSLHEVGEWDEKSGQLKPLTAPIHLGQAVEFKNQPSSPVQQITQ